MAFERDYGYEEAGGAVTYMDGFYALLTSTGNDTGIAYVRPELRQLMYDYRLIEDCIFGQRVIKLRRELYLPKPNAEDCTPQNNARYEAYLRRAVFYNVTKRTRDGLTGYVFSRDPEITVPALMDNVVSDSDGAGIDLTQAAKRSLGHVLSFGRAGVLTDYPPAPDGSTVSDLATGQVRPTIVAYHPYQIRNWRTMVRGAKVVLSMVVLLEKHVWDDDGFQELIGVQFRVLRLDPVSGHYTVELWYANDPNSTDFILQEQYSPSGGDGQPITDLPFTFIGSENNDSNPDLPPLLDMANLNIAHYRNSADYEESCFICGQPTPVVTGLSEQWYEKVLNKQINFGSRGGIPLPVGGTAMLIQAEPNSMIKEAMDHKERQMVALGAKLIEDSTIARTATEARMDDTSETSILATCAKNVGTAYQYALEWAAKFMGVAETEVTFEINTNFDLATMDALTRAQLLKEWQSGAISWTEYRENMRKSGLVSQDDDVAQAEIEKAEETQLGKEQDAAAVAAQNAPAVVAPGVQQGTSNLPAPATVVS